MVWATKAITFSPPSWSIASDSSATTRWGSASADGSIRLNWRLVHFGMPVIDYVVAHELAHLREMNHSPAFWAVVARLYPGYQTPRRWLKTQGNALHGFRFAA